MLALTYKTRGNSTPQGKERVYFTAHPEDFDRYYEEITDDILAHQNCAIYSDPAPGASRTLEELQLELDRMQLMVLPVTARFLYTENRARCLEFRYAMERHIPVLPLMYEPGLEGEFNRICGSLQFLNKQDTRFNPIPYGEKLKKYLESVLLGDDLARQVRQAFDAYIFLSYRKKDRLYAQELMKLIHRNDFARDIAIWYDEYLTPGENFNDAIAAAMEKSDLFALAVTPNLVNEENYVMTVEYPEASKAGKPILPVEMEKTDRAALELNYVNIPATVDAHDELALAESLRQNLKTIAIAENDRDPQHLFFIGLAYLGGIDVEVDHEKALELLTRSAELDFPDAMKKLSDMYQNGEAVELDFGDAVRWAERLADHYERTLEANDPQILIAQGDLALLYHSAGRFREALAMEEAVLEKRIRILGPEHLDTMSAMSNLAVYYYAVGRTADAIKQAEEALATRTRVLGEEHPDTLMSMSNLAVDYQSAGRFQDSIALAQKALEKKQEVLGREHPDTLTSMNNLAAVYSSAGQLQEAMELEEETLSLRKRILGDTHPDTLMTMSNLSDSYRNLGRFQEAIELGEKTLEKRQKVLGQEHPDTLTSMSNLAMYYDDRKQHSEALELGEKAVKLRTEILGENHPDTLLSLGNLSLLYSHAKQNQEAAAQSEELLRRQKQVLGEKHPHTLLAMNNLAEYYCLAGQPEKALPLNEQVVRLRTQVLGSDHPDTLLARNDLAVSWYKLGNVKMAIELGKAVLEDDRRILGEEHPCTCRAFENIITYRLANNPVSNLIRTLKANRKK